ncbi:MAG: hypothetical protein MAG795_01187 [Candidatus Woesearchaeota archaeon]|nr:hypothetical protein [Candidatus Woesearchaeota archaeon]
MKSKKRKHKAHGADHESVSITLSKITLWKAVSGVLAVLLLVSIFTGGFKTKSEANNGVLQADEAQQAKPREDAQAPSAPTLDMAKLLDDDAVKGDENALVTIVEWSDFECPFCARFYSQTLPQIQKDYIDTGKVKFIYRDFPLNFHANAQKAAEAAECAGEQGKYWEMHDKLFEGGVESGVSLFKTYATEINLNTKKFNSCLDSGKMASEVATDMQAGKQVGITGTPGFIINGKLVSGAQPFGVFKNEIEEALAR